MMTGVTDRQRGPYGVTPVLDDAKYTHRAAAIVTSARRSTDEGLKSTKDNTAIRAYLSSSIFNRPSSIFNFSLALCYNCFIIQARERR